MKLLILFLGMFFIVSASANECFIFYDIKGVSIYQGDEAFSDDGFNKKEFIFIVNKGMVIPDKLTNGLSYKYIPPATFIGFDKNKDSNYVEIWSADLKYNTLYFNRVRTGDSYSNGSSAFVGKYRNCN